MSSQQQTSTRLNSVNNNNNSTSKNNNENSLRHTNSNGIASGSIVKTASVKRNIPISTQTHHAARTFQYESFHVFDWDAYLIVSYHCYLFEYFEYFASN